MSSIAGRFTTRLVQSNPLTLASHNMDALRFAASLRATTRIHARARGFSSVVPPPPSSNRDNGTLKHQDDLPKMPIPALEETMQRYLDCMLPLLPTDEAKENTRKAVKHFVENDGPSIHQKLLDYDGGHVNYVEDFYREMFSGADCSNYSLNPNFVMFPDAPASGKTAPSTAAKLTTSCLHYMLATRDGSFPPTVNKKGAIDMSQLPWVLSSARVAREDPVDDLVSYIDHSRHIVVLCRGAAYKLTVLDEEFNIMADVDTLEQRFQEIIDHANTKLGADPRSSAVGALTTISDRKAWGAARTRLQQHNGKNGEYLDTIDSAICVIALDNDVTGLTGEGMERNVMYGLPTTVENRWMDKWNIIVAGDGQAGMNWEHSKLDGHTMMEFFAPVAAAYENGYETKANREAVQVEHLAFDVDAQTSKEISDAIQTSLKLSESVGVAALEFQEFGGNRVKSLKCSPDGFAQGAMFIAFHDLYNRQPVPYESVLAKQFKHGRVTVSRNSSQVIADSLKQWRSLSQEKQKETFHIMIKDISRICLDAAAAHDFDRPLFAYRCLAGSDFPIFKDEAWTLINTHDLCTSHCGREPIRFFGYEPPNPTGFSIGYFVAPERMQFSINHSNQEEAEKFKHQLGNVIRELGETLAPEK